MTTSGDFIDLNAQRLVRTHPNIHKVRPGVVRRNHPEPDREFVDKPKEPSSLERAAAAPGTKEEAPPVAARKKRAKVDADTRAVAVARVDKLVTAGTAASKAVATVAKELGVSESAVMNWRTAARKAPKPAKERASKKTTGRRGVTGQIRDHLSAPVELGPLDIALDLLEFASRARALLSPASRKRLLTELESRLS